LEERGLEGYVALGREGKTPQHEPHQSFPATVRMHEKLQREEGQAHYRRRKGIVEPVNGWIKEILGFRR
ncbi:MAG: IS5/IS1182 family transposase, partial [Armatimonadetes bacterium]|nr:IS5/IS1182 family transposase [Armatimonadota bacterium]NIO96753.1 IS5/IS1182 family transposase [Armatimonadota bacterium]